MDRPASRPETRDEMLAALRNLKPWLEEQGVTDLRLFGSFARDRATKESDVDLLCRLKTTAPWRKIVALRHRIAHGYASVDPGILRGIALDGAPALLAEIEALDRP